MGRAFRDKGTSDGAEGAGKKPWHRPELTTIDIQHAELNAGFSVDGPYGPSS